MSLLYYVYRQDYHNFVFLAFQTADAVGFVDKLDHFGGNSMIGRKSNRSVFKDTFSVQDYCAAVNGRGRLRYIIVDVVRRKR
jgi:hypothetical protein